MRYAGLAALLAATTGCAQIESRSTVQVVPRPEMEPRWLGEARTVVGRDLSISWGQSMSTVEVQLHEHRRCRAVLHEPVDRVESVDRSVKHGALYWEYGAGAALLAVGLAALIKPEAFSPRAVNSDGTQGRDAATGYRIGGVFTALGAGLVGIGAYDTVRSRDTTTTTRAYRLTTGDSTPCIDPEGTRSGVKVELAVGPWTSTATTDADGVARFGLPSEAEMGIALPEPEPEPEPEPAPEPPASEPTPAVDGDIEPPHDAPNVATPPASPPTTEAVATVRIDDSTATFTLVAPLASPEARDRSGEADCTPQGVPHPKSTAP